MRSTVVILSSPLHEFPVVVPHQMQGRRTAAQSLEFAVELIVRTADHDHGTADQQFGVEHLAARQRDAEKLPGAEGSRVERCGLGRSLDMDVRDDRVLVPTGSRGYRTCDPLTNTVPTSGKREVVRGHSIAGVPGARAPGSKRGAKLRVQLTDYLPGFTNFSVIRSDSPIARYLARSLSPSVSVGGRVHTPSG